MADNFQPGYDKYVIFQATGGAAVVLNVKGWSSDKEVATFDVTTTRHEGAGTARLRGKHDSRGNVTACYDADQAPHAAPPSVIPGTSGVLVERLQESVGYQTPIVVKKVHYEAAVESEVRWNFDWEENILAGNKGIIAI